MNGMTEGPPQADLAHTIASLRILYGVPSNVRAEKLTELSRVAEEVTGVASAPNRGITGTNVFDLNAPGDEYVQESKVDPLFHCSLVPEVVGNKSHLIVSVGTGPYSIWDKLEELGFHALSKDQVAAVYAKLQQELRKLGRPMDDIEIKTLARKVIGEPGADRLVSNQ